MAKRIVGQLVYTISGESKELEVSLGRAKKRTADLTRFIKSAVGLGGAVVAFRALTRIGKDLVQSYAEQEQAEAGLAAAIRATGGDVEETMARYSGLANAIQRTTTVGDEVALGLMQQARSMGVADERMEEATRGAIGLSKAFGVDMNTALRGVALAYEGNFTQLSRYIPALRGAKTDAERMAIAQKAMGDGFKIAEAEAKTGSGTMAQLANSLGDLKEVGGQLLSETLVPLLEWALPKLRETVDWISSVRSSAADWAAFERGEGLASVKNKAKHVEELNVAYRDAEAWLLDLKKEEQAYIDKGRRVPESLKKKMTEVYNLIASIQKARTELASYLPAEQKAKEALDKTAKAAREAAEAERLRAEAAAAVEALVPLRRKQQTDALELQVEHERQAIVDLNNFRLAQLQATLSEEERLKNDAAEKDRQREQQLQQFREATFDFVQGLISGIDQLNQAALSNDLALLEQRQNRELEAFEGTREEKKALELEFEKERAELEYQAALKSWKLQRLGALAAIARSILEAAKNAWPFPALPMMALAGVLGGIQLAAINRAKPVPAFAEGVDMIVPPGFENDNFPFTAQTGERLTVTPPGETPPPFSIERPLVLQFDGKPFYEGLLKATQNKIALVSSRALVRRG
jgi:hypothetical protein